MSESIGAGKRLDDVSILVEYTFEFGSMGFHECSCDDEPQMEYERCNNLRELLNALSQEKLEELKNDMDAKKVFVTNVIVRGKNIEGDSTNVSFSNRETSGYTRAKISETDIDSKMNDCVKELEKQVKEMQNTITRYRA